MIPEIGVLISRRDDTGNWSVDFSEIFDIVVGSTAWVETSDSDGDNTHINWEMLAVYVTIDIHPGSDKNPINVKEKGVVPVAILGSESFDVRSIDVTTLAFGGTKLVPPAHNLNDPSVYEDHLKDVNSDGFMDLVSHYSVQEAGIVCGDISAMLIGMTTSGENFQGVDRITTVGCK
jgi:hypothetical protein